MDYTDGYGYEDDYLDEDDDGLMCSTKDYHSASDDDQDGDSFCNLQKKKSASRICSKNDVEDEFQKQMSAELSQTMKKLTLPLLAGECSEKQEVKKTNLAEKKFYDDIYFDTDESDEEEQDSSSTKKKMKRRIQTDEDLLYDPKMDEEDQKWVDRRRRSYQMKKLKANNTKPLPQSDAVLNCPACFTTLCLDCQRHEIYKEQYRAMFVFNCITDNSEILHFTKKENKKSKSKKERKSHQFEDALRTSTIYFDENEVVPTTAVKANETNCSSIGKDPINVEKNEDSLNKNENSMKGNETSMKGNEDSCKENETSMKENETSMKGNEDSLKENEDSHKENETSIQENEISMNENSFKENENSTKENEDSIKEHKEKQKSVRIIEPELVRPVQTLLLQSEDDFHPVNCSVCNTVVGVQDKDEIYHFFNVVTSY